MVLGTSDKSGLEERGFALFRAMDGPLLLVEVLLRLETVTPAQRATEYSQPRGEEDRRHRAISL